MPAKRSARAVGGRMISNRRRIKRVFRIALAVSLLGIAVGSALRGHAAYKLTLMLAVTTFAIASVGTTLTILHSWRADHVGKKHWP